MAKKPKKHQRKARLVYINQGDGSDEQKLEDLEKAYALDPKPDVIALGEHADRIDVTTEFCRRHPEYTQYYGDGTTGAAKECLIYRRALGEELLKKTIVLVKARKLGKGAGPENATNKCALHVKLRFGKRGRRRMHLIVAHQYATVRNRRQAAWLFMNSLMDIVRSVRGVVFFFGDLNAGPGHALVRALRALFTGSSSSTSGPTHKRNLIDYIMARGVRILGAFTRHISSDHEMVVMDVLY